MKGVRAMKEETTITFLASECGEFHGMGECIECTPFIKEPSVEDIFKTNEEIYSLAQRKIEGIAKKG